MSLDIDLVRKVIIPEHVEERTEFEANITHNLTKMAREAGIYQALWRPEELFENPKAKDLISILEQGLAELKAEPERFKTFNPENKWGSYEGLVNVVETYFKACKEFPDADVVISR